MNEHDDTPAVRIRLAAARGMLFGGVAVLLVVFLPVPLFANAVGDVVLCGWSGVLVGGIAYYESRLLREGWGLAPAVVGTAFLVAGATPLVWLQAAYGASVLQTGSFSVSLSAALQAFDIGPEMFGYWFCMVGPLAVSQWLRFGAFPLARKRYFAVALALGAAIGLGASIAELAGGPWYQYLTGLGGAAAAVLLHIGLSGVFVLPGVAVVLEGREGSPPRAGSSARFQRARWIAAGLVIPVLAFAASEAGAGLATPEWQAPQLSTWLALAQGPGVQRVTYPLLIYAMVAFAAARFWRARGVWIEVGLAGGVVLAGVYCVIYLNALALSCFALLIGIGVLGLGPYFAFVAYSNAWFDYRADSSGAAELGQSEESAGDCSHEAGEFAATPVERLGWEAEPEGSPDARVHWVAAWLVGAGFTAWFAAQRLAEDFAALPPHPPDNCYIATAASRASPLLSGAQPVKFADGRVALVSRQLRVLKVGELVIARRCPRGHRALRWAYDRLGPILARRMGALSGSLVFLTLLPVQAGVEGLLRLAGLDLASLLKLAYPSPLDPSEEAPTQGAGGLSHRGSVDALLVRPVEVALSTLSEQARRKVGTATTDEALLLRLAEDLKKHLLSRDIPTRRNAPKPRSLEVVRALAMLDIPGNASYQQVTRAWDGFKKTYKAAMMRTHPDVSGHESTAHAQRINADHDLRKKAFRTIKKALE
ncbi:MAG: hypothetical protein JKY65_33290 [Planctomycetes bacterium]|nr:hypothetical protein [Planctomycetota bacterium]